LIYCTVLFTDINCCAHSALCCVVLLQYNNPRTAVQQLYMTMTWAWQSMATKAVATKLGMGTPSRQLLT
jgi:hypothetical protein